MSMSRADILYSCIGDLLDDVVVDEVILSQLYKMLSQLHDIAEAKNYD